MNFVAWLSTINSASGVTMGYRADGLRAWKQTATGRTYYLYDGDTLIGEVDGATGVVTSRQSWGADGLISRGGQFFVYDPTGNVAQRLDASGAVVSTALFSAYGNPVAANGVGSATNDDVVGYKGKFGYYTDTETGFILCTHRYYDPSMGRWLNRDPIGYDGGINIYAYCENNPVMRIDPLGLDFELIEWKEPRWFWQSGNYEPASKEAEKKFYTALKYLSKDKLFAHVIRKLQLTPTKVKVDIGAFAEASYSDKDKTIHWNPKVILQCVDDNGKDIPNQKLSTGLLLGHEMVHAYNSLFRPKETAARVKVQHNTYDDNEELYVIRNFENLFARKYGEGVRFNHRGRWISVK